MLSNFSFSSYLRYFSDLKYFIKYNNTCIKIIFFKLFISETPKRIHVKHTNTIKLINFNYIKYFRVSCIDIKNDICLLF